MSGLRDFMDTGKKLQPTFSPREFMEGQRKTLIEFESWLENLVVDGVISDEILYRFRKDFNVKKNES